MEHLTEKEITERQFMADWAQLVADGINFVVSAAKYNVADDNRMLIPYISHHKIGFVNKSAQYVIKAKYDKYYGEALNEDDLIKVAIRYSYGLPGWKKDQILTYDRDKWGIIDTKGDEIVKTEYKSISISDDKSLFTLQDFSGEYHVQNRNGEIIVSRGCFDYIDGFTKGYARVKMSQTTNGKYNSGAKWGIINSTIEIVLPIEYDNIWNFHEGKDWPYTTIVKNGSSNEKFWFETGSTIKRSIAVFTDFSEDRHYGEFAGTYAQDVMGYDDETINDAFDGEADAYWNID